MSIPKAANVLGEQISNLLIGQLLIVLVKRAGGEVTLPIPEVDDTARYKLDLSANHHDCTFTLSLSKKS